MLSFEFLSTVTDDCANRLNVLLGSFLSVVIALCTSERSSSVRIFRVKNYIYEPPPKNKIVLGCAARCGIVRILSLYFANVTTN